MLLIDWFVSGVGDPSVCQLHLPDPPPVLYPDTFPADSNLAAKGPIFSYKRTSMQSRSHLQGRQQPLQCSPVL
jgi:hypothetical protein